MVTCVMSWSRFHNIRVANLTLYTYNYYMYAKRTLVYAPTSALVYIKYMDIYSYVHVYMDSQCWFSIVVGQNLFYYTQAHFCVVCVLHMCYK
jgi:hypothetical protein